MQFIKITLYRSGNCQHSASPMSNTCGLRDYLGLLVRTNPKIRERHFVRFCVAARKGLCVTLYMKAGTASLLRGGSCVRRFEGDYLVQQ